jgi:SH3-like domain-containing protein
MRARKGVSLVREGLVALLTVGLVASVAVAAGSAVRVRVETANVREGPGTQYQRLWTVGRDFPLDVIARRGRWLKTRDFLDSEGWIFAPLTDATPAAIVQVDEARVRSGPGLSHEVRFVATWGESFPVLSHRGEWVKIDDPDNGRGWIHESLVWTP